MQIEKSIHEVWGLLNEGVMQRKSAFHTLSLAYFADDVECCTVVLQSCNQGLLRFHTHAHAPKASAIKINPRITLLGYDRAQKIQIRLKAEVSIYCNDDVSQAIWSNMKESSKLCYQLNPPGSLHLTANTSATLRENVQRDPQTGFENFAVCHAKVDCVDVLILNHEKHRRWLYQLADMQWVCKELQA